MDSTATVDYLQGGHIARQVNATISAKCYSSLPLHVFNNDGYDGIRKSPFG